MAANYVYLLYIAIFLLGLVMASGCTAQTGIMTRPQPAGGEVVNPWLLSTQDRKFNELEKSFQEQIARAERLDPGSEEVKILKSEYQKIKQLWQLKQEENTNVLSELTDTFVNSVGITMKLIKPDGVTITEPFYIGVYEVTGQQYSRVMGGSGSPAPKVMVNLNDSMAFCRRLSMKEGLNYTLPTEVQWEYACRAGTTTAYSFGEKWDEAASRQPNPWGLYDMHGNVCEWCSNRVLRGGSWILEPCICRSASRFRSSPDLRRDYFGFRIILDLN